MCKFALSLRHAQLVGWNLVTNLTEVVNLSHRTEPYHFQASKQDINAKASKRSKVTFVCCINIFLRRKVGEMETWANIFLRNENTVYKYFSKPAIRLIIFHSILKITSIKSSCISQCSDYTEFSVINEICVDYVSLCEHWSFNY